ncbi:endoglin [Microcaecilia unicolor]|uniref:Endoglin n=1 Tax=Microcaecilia unicolor TaxID=1415580 RepID=A0A6P7YFL2_9AMPH|nr:endoglin [Microcaecilia unicolor]
MELAFSLTVWVLCCLLLHAANAAGDQPRCDILPGQKSPVSAVYTSSKTVRGCLRTSPTDQVHVLNMINSGQPDISVLILEVEAAVNPLPPEVNVLFVLQTTGYFKIFLLFSDVLQNHPVSIHLPLASDLFSNHQLMEINKTNLPTDSEELLRWTKEEYGDITSFAELRSPLKIRFTVGVGILGSQDCHLQTDFNAKRYMECDYRPNEIQVCKVLRSQETKQAFMLQVHWDQGEAGTQLTSLNVTMECSVKDNEEDTLILQSNSGQIWNITSHHSIKILASGRFHLNGFQIPEHHAPIKVPSSPDELWDFSRERNIHIASYMAVHSASHVTVILHNCDIKSTKEPIITTDASIPGKEQLIMLISLLQPWVCDRDSLDIVLAKKPFPNSSEPIFAGITLRDKRCSAEENGTHLYLTTSVKDCFTEVDHKKHVKNEMSIILMPSADVIQVPFECVPQQSPSVEIHLSRSSEFTKLSTIIEANKIIYAQVFVNPATAESQFQLKECWLQLEGEWKIPLILQDFSSDPAIDFLIPAKESPGMKTHQFSFIYKAEEGRLVQPANLKCLLCLQTKKSNSDCPRKKQLEKSLEVILTNPNTVLPVSGLGMVAVLSITFGAFLTGALLTAALWCIYSHTRPPAKPQPVPGNQAASESSSANHSIGSTQSTPCSTSSMA